MTRHYPHLDETSFGRIVVDGVARDRDIVIRADRSLRKRKKGLSREETGSAHTIGRAEIEWVAKGDPVALFIGTGQNGVCELSPSAVDLLEARGIGVHVARTPQILAAYNGHPGPKAALVHITC